MDLKKGAGQSDLHHVASPPLPHPRRLVLTITPSTDGRGAFQDPTHVSFWNSNSFWYYTRPEQARFIHSPVLFEANRVKNFYPSDWHREHQIVYVKADLTRRLRV
jgi:hypothetical protein